MAICIVVSCWVYEIETISDHCFALVNAFF